MTLSNFLITIFFLLCLTFISCNDNNHLNQSKSYRGDTTNRRADTTRLSKEESIQRQVWIKFMQAILSKKYDSFRKLSLPYIYTPDLSINQLKSVDDTTSTKDCISTDKFITDNFLTVFNKRQNDFYFNVDNVRWIKVNLNSDNYLKNCYRHKKGANYKMLEVCIIEKGCFGGPDECLTEIFLFINDNNKYKFYGMYGIP